jgi:signal recognition particle GTPase
MFEQLSEKLENTFARLRGRGVLTEADLKEGLREIRRVLLEADVNFQLTREFLERVEKKPIGSQALRSVSPGQQLVKIVHEELAAMLGERREGLRLSSVPPTVVMLVGLQGSGKTTTAAKLALRLRKKDARRDSSRRTSTVRPRSTSWRRSAAIWRSRSTRTAGRRTWSGSQRTASSNPDGNAIASSSWIPPAGCRSTMR